MKKFIIPGLIALIILLALPGAVSAGDNVLVSGSILPPAPVAAFSATPLVGVAPLYVTFTDMSTGTIDSWKWEYNDGSGWTEFSTDQNPEKEFTTAGPYDVRLTVTNAGGSDDETKTHYIATANVREPLITVQSDTVSGDLYVSSPHTYDSGVTEVTRTFDLPAAAVGNIQWAMLYVNTYSGSAANTYALTSTVKLDGATVGIETMDIASEINGHSYPLNDHVNKVYSDYEAQYEVTTLISSASPEVNVKSEAIPDKQFDGRIKAVTLVVAYNDGDSDQVNYWVNHGGDWSSPGSGSTTFDTTGITAGWNSAQSTIRYISSSDADYTFNGVSKPKSTPPDYSGTLNIWDVSSDLTAGLSSSLEYSKTSGSYKTNLATLVVRYTSPAADFSATPLTGDAPLEVAFTDASTGATSWAWDFNNDGTTDSTDQNPTHTYTTVGTYSVKLTVEGPLGSDSITKTDYISVKEPAPAIDFSATPTSGPRPLTVAFTATNTGGQVNSWAWDFGDGGTSSEQNPTHVYQNEGTYTVALTATGPDYTDTETKTSYIQVGAATIEVTVGPESIDFGTMSAGTDETGSTALNVDVTGGTAWSVSAAASNGGYMGSGTANLANPFQISRDGTNFQAMTSSFENFLTGTAGTGGTGTANVKQLIDASDAPGNYAITITFTGGFS